MITLKPLRIFAIVCMMASFTAMAQDFNTSTLTYSWSDKLPEFTPDSTDKTYSTVYVLAKRINEFRFDVIKKTFDFYYCSHNIKYINDNKAIEDNNKFYASVGQLNSFVGINIRVIDKGKVIFEATENDFIEVLEDGRKFNMVAIKGLDKGMLLETITRTKYSDFEVYDEEYMQYSMPVKTSEFYLITPSNLVFKCKSYNGFSPITDSLVNDRRIYYGKTLNIPATRDNESYSFVNANKMRVEYNFHQNTESKKFNAKWPELGRSFYDRMNYNYDKNVKDIAKMLAKLKWKDAPNNTARVYMIENFLKQQISIDKNVDDKATIMETFKAHVASPFRFNQIMAQCFRFTQCNVEYILTCKRDYKKFDPEFDSWSYLKNVLFYEPESKKFIDPQEPLLRIGFINNSYLDQHGLFIKIIRIGEALSASASVRQIPANDVKKSVDYENYKVSFNANADLITLNYNRSMHDYSEQGIKGVYYIMDDDTRKEFISNFVKGMAKDSKVDGIEVLNYDPTVYDNLEKPLIINASISTDDYIEAAGQQSFLLKVGEIIGQQAQMYQEKTRITPAEIEFAHAYNRVITIAIPEGYTVKGLEKLNIDIAYKNGREQASLGFTSSYKYENNVLTILCNEYYNDLYYPVGMFNQFKEVINAAADFNKITILFEKQ